jgi:hypothetical protein
LAKLTSLQWEYNQALENGGKNLSLYADNMLSEYTNQANAYLASYTANNNELAKAYARGADTSEYGADLRKYVKFNIDGSVDASALEEAFDN